MLFKKAPKAVQLVPCPTCGQPMGPQVAVMVQQAGTKKRRLPIRHRPGRSNSHHFETTAQSIAAAAQPKWRDRRPVLEPGQSDSTGPLSPGEKRNSTVYHQWSLADIGTSLALAGVSGLLAGLSSLVVCVPLRTKWYWPAGIWLGTTVIVWGLRAKDFFDNDKAVISSQEQERVPEPAPIIQEPPAVEIVIKSADGKTQRRPKLWAPRSNHAGLWQYADALVRGIAAPSYSGGKGNAGVFGAKAYGYTPTEFDGREDRWRPVAIAGGILEKDPHKSKGYRVTEVGKRALAVIVKRRLGE